MGDIYTRAQRVLIWLGEDNSLKAGPIFSLLKYIAQLDMDTKTDDDDEADDDADDDDADDDDADDADSDNDYNIKNDLDKVNVSKTAADKRIRKEVEYKMQRIWNSKKHLANVSYSLLKQYYNM
jgi:hypothetical protein